MALADAKGMHKGVIYATQGNVGDPGNTTTDGALGLLDIQAKLGAGVTIAAVTPVAAR